MGRSSRQQSELVGGERTLWSASQPVDTAGGRPTVYRELSALPSAPTRRSADNSR